MTNENKPAEHVAIVGAGAGGSRIADAFFALGYETFWVNTTDQDAGKGLQCPNKVIISSGEQLDGAAKDPEKGRRAFEVCSSDVIEAMNMHWHTPDRILICVGAGGGTGSGAALPLIDAAKKYADLARMQGDISKKVGVIVSVPKRTEPATVQRNALELLKSLFELADKGKISPLILLDNDSIISQFDVKQPVKGYWTKVNDFFARVYHSFNALTGRSSDLEVFDPAEYQKVLESGFVVFGKAVMKGNLANISAQLRDVLTKTLLVNGVDFKTAKFAGAIATGNDAIWTTVPRDDIDNAISMLAEFLKVDTVCLGIYEDETPDLRVFTIVGGMAAPQKRLADLETRGK